MTDTDPTAPASPPAPNRRFTTPVIAAIGCVAVIVVLLIAWFAVSNSVTNDGNAREASLSAKYSDSQNSLSNCMVKTAQSAQIATTATDRIGAAITDVIKARTPIEQDATQTNLVSALREAYPNIDTQQMFDKLMNTANGCRDDFAAIQTDLLDELRQYNTWRTGSFTVRTFGDEYPTSNLEARTGPGKPKTGQAALDAMRTIVTVTGVKDAFDTGTIEAPDLFPTTTVG